MVQVIPDETVKGSPAELERKLEGFKFDGAGLYAYEKRTIIVLPMIPQTEVDKIWRHTQPEGIKYEAHVYGVNFNFTVFHYIGTIPTRKDEW